MAAVAASAAAVSVAPPAPPATRTTKAAVKTNLPAKRPAAPDSKKPPPTSESLLLPPLSLRDELFSLYSPDEVRVYSEEGETVALPGPAAAIEPPAEPVPTEAATPALEVEHTAPAGTDAAPEPDADADADEADAA